MDSSRRGADQDRDIPLSVKYETKPLWRDCAQHFEVAPTGAAIAVALYEAAMIGNSLTSYSRSRDYYAKQRRHPLLSYCKVVPAVDRLADGGWIENYKQRPGGRGWQSSMIATPPLVSAVSNILAAVPPLRLNRPLRTILLRDQDGIELDLPQTREIQRMSRKIEAINEAITASDVRAVSGVGLSCPVVRIFNADQKLSRGGRMYAAGTSWQNIPKMDRSRIKIDDEAVVEIDYSTLHPAMLYAEAGAPLPADCYDIGDWDRSAVKLGLLTLINAGSRMEAWHSLAHNADFSPTPSGSPAAFELAARLIDDIKRAHSPISGAFHRDAGARLMRQDSDLAIAVVTALMNRSIVALPVHDSFLVPASKRDELEAAMLTAAHSFGLRNVRVAEA